MEENKESRNVELYLGFFQQMRQELTFVEGSPSRCPPWLINPLWIINSKNLRRVMNIYRKSVWNQKTLKWLKPFTQNRPWGTKIIETSRGNSNTYSRDGRGPELTSPPVMNNPPVINKPPQINKIINYFSGPLRESNWLGLGKGGGY